MLNKLHTNSQGAEDLPEEELEFVPGDHVLQGEPSSGMTIKFGY